MKKVISIFFLTILVLPFYCTYLYLQHEKASIRKLVKRHIIRETPLEELKYLVFSVKQAETLLKWEHSGEFEYNGRMYDVVYRKTANDSLFLWCWEDNEETAVNQKFKELWAQAVRHNPLSQEKSRKLLDFMKNLYCSSIYVSTESLDHEQSIKIIYIQSYDSRKQKSEIPPPEFS